MNHLIAIQKDDIPYEQAFRAYAGTSWDPDSSVAVEQRSYIQDMTAFVTELESFVTNENRTAMQTDLETYKADYLNKFLAVLSAQSRIINPMIAGASKFPSRRMATRNDVEEKRRAEFLDWRNKAQERLRNTYDPNRIARQPISSDDENAVDKLRAKIAELEAHQERMKAVNVILRNKKLTAAQKVEQCSTLGVAEKIVRILLTPDRGKDIGYQTFELSNNSANIRRYKQRLAGLERQQQDTTQTFEIGRVRVVDNVEDFRVQLFFPERTSKDLYHELRHAGFVWSPTNQAFQRKRSTTALSLAKDLAAKF